MSKLKVILADGTEQEYDLEGDVVTIGRLPDNTIQIDDASVSSHHAQVEVRGETFVLKDLDSTNGTLHNGQVVTETELGHNDSIRFGKIHAKFLGDEGESHSKPMPEEDREEAVVAANSARPSNFENASPFQTKQQEKVSIGGGFIAFAAVCLFAFLFAIYQVSTIQAP